MQTFVQETDGDLLVVSADGGLDRDTAQQLIDDVRARQAQPGGRGESLVRSV